jgi:membrane protein YdbS with pleckstrin-like domain
LPAGVWTIICLGWVLWFWATRSGEASSVVLGGTVLVVAVASFLLLTLVAVIVVWISPQSPRVFRWGVKVPARVAAIGVGVMTVVSFLGSRPGSLDVPVGLWLASLS